MALTVLRPESLSVRTRLFLVIFAPSVLVLLVATIAALVSDVIELRRTLEQRASIDAELLAHATRSPLAIGEPTSAEIILEGLKSNPDVRAAAVYRDTGEIFVQYPRNGNLAPTVPREGREGDRYQVVVPLKSGTEEIGSLWLQISLARYYARIRYYSVAVVTALVLLCLVAAGLAGFLQRRFSAPIEELVTAARKISGEQDYSIRAPVFEAPEFKALTDAFNHMLDRIERQNQALTERTVQLEKANANLSSANKELEAFTYTVSHDLRTPLRAISSYSHLLREELGKAAKPEAEEFIERIQKNSVKMAQLIDELLAFSRLDAHPLEKTKVEIRELVRQVWQDLTGQVPPPRAEITIGEVPSAEVDPLLIRQVFTNLLGNALKYSRTRTKPMIEAGSFAQNGERIYFVRDNGVGFNMAYASKLFGIFQRLHAEHEFEGTGVGLAIVHRIISRHGGRIWAESQPDQGATFYFTLSAPNDGEKKHSTG